MKSYAGGYFGERAVSAEGLFVKSKASLCHGVVEVRGGLHADSRTILVLPQRVSWWRCGALFV